MGLYSGHHLLLRQTDHPGSNTGHTGNLRHSMETDFLRNFHSAHCENSRRRRPFQRKIILPGAGSRKNFLKLLLKFFDFSCIILLSTEQNCLIYDTRALPLIRYRSNCLLYRFLRVPKGRRYFFSRHARKGAVCRRHAFSAGRSGAKTRRACTGQASDGPLPSGGNAA